MFKMWKTSRWVRRYLARAGVAILPRIAVAEDIDAGNAQLEGILARTPGIDFQHVYLPMPQERHATIFHPAALLAFRQMLAPAAQKAR